MTLSMIIFLSFIQGFAEALPISSSSHLEIFQRLLHINTEGSFAFDIALHLGTTLSIICIFYKECLVIIKDCIQITIKKNSKPELLYKVILSTIPVVIVGLIITKLHLLAYIKTLPIIAINLIIFGIILYIADTKNNSNITFEKINKKQALIIGLGQALSLIPGVSRSGICITTARLLGVDKISAIKYAMLISIPATLGAVLLTFIKDYNRTIFEYGDFILGIICSFIFGLIFIKLLLAFIKKFSFKIFMLYRIIMGVAILVYVYWI